MNRKRRKPPKATHYVLLDSWRLVTLLQVGRKWVHYLETYEQPEPHKKRMAVKTWLETPKRDVIWSRGQARLGPEIG